jgi:peptide/nickel transport system substrate-binding protein
MTKKNVFAILVLLVMVLSACAQATTVVEEPAVEEPAAEEPMAEEPMGEFKEAPMLAEKVTAGALPTVEERLPDEPFVVGPGIYMTNENLPDWTPGKYGGTLRSSHSVANWNPDIFVMMNEPFLMAPKIGDQNIVCNICQSYRVSMTTRSSNSLSARASSGPMASR